MVTVYDDDEKLYTGEDYEAVRALLMGMYHAKGHMTARLEYTSKDDWEALVYSLKEYVAVVYECEHRASIARKRLQSAVDDLNDAISAASTLEEHIAGHNTVSPYANHFRIFAKSQLDDLRDALVAQYNALDTATEYVDRFSLQYHVAKQVYNMVVAP